MVLHKFIPVWFFFRHHVCRHIMSAVTSFLVLFFGLHHLVCLSNNYGKISNQQCCSSGSRFYSYNERASMKMFTIQFHIKRVHPQNPLSKHNLPSVSVKMAHFVGKCLNISPCPYTQTALTSGYWLHIACKIEWGINMITGDVNGVGVSSSCYFLWWDLSLKRMFLLACPLGFCGSRAAERREGEMGILLNWKISQLTNLV